MFGRGSLDISMGPAVDGPRGCLFDGRSRKGGVENTLSVALYADLTYHCYLVYCGGSAKISHNVYILE